MKKLAKSKISDVYFV